DDLQLLWQFTQAQLGAGQIGQDGDVGAVRAGPLHARRLGAWRRVRQVHPQDVDARVQQPFQLTRCVLGGADGGDDLGPTVRHESTLPRRASAGRRRSAAVARLRLGLLVEGARLGCIMMGRKLFGTVIATFLVGATAGAAAPAQTAGETPAASQSAGPSTTAPAPASPSAPAPAPTGTSSPAAAAPNTSAAPNTPAAPTTSAAPNMSA